MTTLSFSGLAVPLSTPAPALVDLAAAVGAQTELTAPEFAATTAPFNDQRLPGATDVNYVMPASTAGLPRPSPPDGNLVVLDRPLDGSASRVGSRVQTEIADALAIARTTDDLLGYATADNITLRLADIDLNTLVDDILTERAATATRTDLPTVTGDPTLIRQVLDNLIGNAVKYTPPGATPEITITAHPGKTGLCRIEVADRGIGIPESQRAEIFNAFTRADGSEKYPGTGLGLAIVQRIVERHGGTVGADANPGGGTRFWLTLPQVNPAQAAG
jgi:signal transduction histidine kinase